MWRFFRHHWDGLSLVAGFLLGLFFQFLLGWVLHLGRQGVQRWRAWRERQTLRSEGRFEQRYARWLQTALRGWHLAAPLFALEEILQPPRLLPPPPLTVPEGEAALEDGVALTVPFSLRWPQLRAFYRAPTLTLPQALQGGAHLLLLGEPGAGKTTALLYLAWLLLRRDAQVQFLTPALPLYLHAAALPLEEGATFAEEGDLLAPLLEALPPEMPEGMRAKLGRLLPAHLRAGRLLLLLDGLDEMPVEEQRRVARYLERLLERFPRMRVVAAAAPDFYDGLTRLGLHPLVVAPWNPDQALAFLERWGRLWQRSIAPQRSEPHPPIDPLLLNRWLLAHRRVTTPLELTLQAWAAYAGDALGSHVGAGWEAYLRRMVPDLERLRPALRAVAVDLLLALRPAVEKGRLGRHGDSGEPLPLEGEGEEAFEEGTVEFQPELEAGLEVASPRRVRRFLPDLLATGVLRPYGQRAVGFVHPGLWAYLAGEALAHTGSAPLAQGPWWAVKTQALGALAAQGGGQEVARSLEQRARAPLYRERHWLALALQAVSGPPPPWKPRLLHRLADAVLDGTQPLGQRAEALTALALSREKGLGPLFRQWLGHSDPHARRLAALGLGLLGDGKALAGLRQALDDEDRAVQQAAALALVALDAEEALTAVAELLLRGDDLQRRAAAEALANHPREGYLVLQEGAALEDLLVRRAVVYGLARVPEAWAREQLARMQVEDDEWVVRSAAAQAVEALEGPAPWVPAPRPPLHDEPWLLAFAAEQGLGVPPGEGAYEVLRRCLREGSEEQVLAALERLIFEPRHDWFPEVQRLLEQGTPDQQQAAWLTLNHLAAAGME